MTAPGRLLALVLLAGAAAARADTLSDGIAALNRKDYDAAARLIEPLARSGSAAAQLHLGLMYYHGHGVPESNEQALQWFERAARSGLPEAQFHLANLYAYGLARPADGADPSRLAAQWYHEAARHGHADAQYSLGILFLTGSGVEQNRSEAQRWIRRAAAQGHADALAYLGGEDDKR